MRSFAAALTSFVLVTVVACQPDTREQAEAASRSALRDAKKAAKAVADHAPSRRDIDRQLGKAERKLDEASRELEKAAGKAAKKLERGARDVGKAVESKTEALGERLHENAPKDTKD